jgi:hypothetical protein
MPTPNALRSILLEAGSRVLALTAAMAENSKPAAASMSMQAGD